jgi:hypothetical protein
LDEESNVLVVVFKFSPLVESKITPRYEAHDKIVVIYKFSIIELELEFHQNFIEKSKRKITCLIQKL